jgi:hypothetical protein
MRHWRFAEAHGWRRVFVTQWRFAEAHGWRRVIVTLAINCKDANGILHVDTTFR